MIKKDDLKEVGCFGIHEKKVYEDWCLWLKLIKAQKFPVRIGSLLTWYRIKPLEESELKKSNSSNKKRAMKLVNEIKRDIVYKKPGVQYPKVDYNWEEILDEQPQIVNVKHGKEKKGIIECSIKIKENAVTELHIDTDDACAFIINQNDEGDLLI